MDDYDLNSAKHCDKHDDSSPDVVVIVLAVAGGIVGLIIAGKKCII
jgi:hypothetical protein